MLSDPNSLSKQIVSCGPFLLRRTLNVVPVLNKLFKTLVTDPRIAMYLLPVPSSVQKATHAVTPALKTSPVPKPQGLQPAGLNKRRKLTRAQKGCPQELKDYDM